MKQTLRLILVVAVLASAGCLGWCGQAREIASEDFGPRELFRRYQQFKDLAAALDATRADIEMYEARVAELSEVPRNELDRIDKEQLAQVRAELIGVRAKYNRMAAQYNAAMAKVNYRFTNVGMLPEGADEPLPREFRTYER